MIFAPRAIAFIAAAAFASSTLAAGSYGNADEAKAMLQQVTADMKKDQAGTIARINKGEYKDRDLYPFCMRASDGHTTAHPTNVGTNILELKDKKGKPFGKEMFAVAEEGKLKTVKYMWPKPGETQPSAKESYVTKVGDQVCGVGFYK
jgi:signal transduction histidine kinase